VAKALVPVFSHFGFAREILSDCVSDYMSKFTDCLNFSVTHFSKKINDVK